MVTCMIESVIYSFESSNEFMKCRLDNFSMGFRQGDRGMIVSYLWAQLASLYTYICLLIMIYYRLGQNQLIINKCSTLSIQFMAYAISKGLAYIITLYTNLVGFTLL